jgi:flagellar biosynthesis chaperone FliJ
MNGYERLEAKLRIPWESMLGMANAEREEAANAIAKLRAERDEARKELSNLSYHHCETMEQHFRVRGWEAPVGGYDL